MVCFFIVFAWLEGLVGGGWLLTDEFMFIHLDTVAPKSVEGSGVVDWLLPDIEVKIVSGSNAGQRGYVVEVVGGGQSASVVIPQTNNTLQSVPITSLEPFPPGKKDRCVFIGGDMKGKLGSLIGMDHDDAIVKLDSTNEFKITALTLVCKLR